MKRHRATRGWALVAAMILLFGVSVAWSQEEDDAASCPDLARMAERLRNGADNCDSAVSSGQLSSCQVSVTFSLTGIPGLTETIPSEVPWLASPATARNIAAELGSVRCVEDVFLESSPPGPLQPGATFQLTATVTMAGGASAEGVVVSLTTDDPDEIAASGAPPRVSRKAALPRAVAQPTILIRADGKGVLDGAQLLSAAPLIVTGSVDRDRNPKVIVPKKKKWTVPVFLPPGRCALGPNEDILSRFYDQTRLGPGFLDKHEGVKPATWTKDVAHTKREHVPPFARYPDDPVAYLRSRQIEFASAYNDQTTAEMVIHDSVTESLLNWLEISAWLYLDGQFPQKFGLMYKPAHPWRIGFGVHESNPGFIETLNGEALTILILNQDTCRIVIYTSFPMSATL